MVRGVVQGVFFRASTRDLALRLGLDGWVRNDPTGTVTVHVEGGPGAVDELVAWLRTGPRHARVVGVDVSDVPPEGHEGFVVRHD